MLPTIENKMKISVLFTNTKQSLETNAMTFKSNQSSQTIAFTLAHRIAEVRALMITNGGRIKGGFNFSRRFEISLNIDGKIVNMPDSNFVDFSKTFRATERKDKEGNIVQTRKECFEKCANAIYRDIHKIVDVALDRVKGLSIDSVTDNVKFLN